MAETNPSITPDKNQQPSLAEERHEINLRLEQLTFDLQQSVIENLRPQALEERVSELQIKVAQHQLRFDQKVEDVKAIFSQLSVMNESGYIDEVKDLLGEDLALVLTHTILDEDDLMRAKSAITLRGTSDPECLKSLCQGLNDKEPYVRVECAASLAGTNDPESLKGLCEGLRDEEFSMCEACADALKGTQDAHTLKWLREVGLQDENCSLRELSAKVLTGTIDPDCLKALREGLKDEDEDVRTACADALAKTSDPDCLKALCHGLKDIFMVRLACMKALQGTSDPDCLKILCDRLKDKNSYLRQLSAWALQGTNNQVCREALKFAADNDSDDGVRQAASEALEVQN